MLKRIAVVIVFVQLAATTVFGASIRDKVMKFGQGEELQVKLQKNAEVRGFLESVGKDSFNLQTGSQTETILFRLVQSVALTPQAKVRRKVALDLKPEEPLSIRTEWRSDLCAFGDPTGLLPREVGCFLDGEVIRTDWERDAFTFLEKRTGKTFTLQYSEVRSLDRYKPESGGGGGEAIATGFAAAGILSPLWLPFTLGKGSHQKFIAGLMGVTVFGLVAPIDYGD